VTGNSLECFGLTRSGSDDSILDIMPRQEVLEGVGALTGGYAASPPGAATQSVMVRFSNKRVKAGADTVYEVRCVNNATTPQTMTYSQHRVPEIASFMAPGELVVSVGDNWGYILIAAIMVILVGGLIVLAWRSSR
jgi:hypothetical protein